MSRSHGDRRLLLWKPLGHMVPSAWLLTEWIPMQFQKEVVISSVSQVFGYEWYKICHSATHIRWSFIKPSWEYCKSHDYKAALLFETYQTKVAWAFYRILFINILVFSGQIIDFWILCLNMMINFCYRHKKSAGPQHKVLRLKAEVKHWRVKLFPFFPVFHAKQIFKNVFYIPHHLFGCSAKVLGHKIHSAAVPSTRVNAFLLFTTSIRVFEELGSNRFSYYCPVLYKRYFSAAIKIMDYL